MARLVYGTGPVGELVRSRPKLVDVVLVAAHRKGKRDRDDPIARIGADARSRGIDVLERDRAELDALAGIDARHQGAIAITGEFEYADVHQVVDAVVARDQVPLVVALDGVQDPRNFGAIVRSAYVLGAHAVVVARDRAARVTPVVTKTSAGATERVAIAQVTNLVRTLEELKQQSLWIAGFAAGERAMPLWDLDATGPLCAVLGSEGRGIRPLIRRACDHVVEIPMTGRGVGSLNVSVAAGIALYELARQRRS